MAVNNEIHRLSEIRKSLEMVLDKVYEETEGQDLEKDFLKIIEQSNLLCQVKNEWKDQWDFDGWARAYDEDVKRDTGALKIYENYETVLQMVFEEVENFQRKDGKILEIGVGTGNLAGKFLQNKSLELINPGRCWQLQKKTCMRKQSAWKMDVFRQ